jgi:hypothetical protein
MTIVTDLGNQGGGRVAPKGEMTLRTGKEESGAPGEIRTPDLLLRRHPKPVLSGFQCHQVFTCGFPTPRMLTQQVNRKKLLFESAGTVTVQVRGEK